MSDSQADPLPPALRIIHLAGGLRAFDLGDETVGVGPAYDKSLMTIPRQPYAALYDALLGIGLTPVGVDFITNSAGRVANGPPDFEVAHPRSGFAVLAGQRAWADVRHVPEQKTPEIIDLAGRFSTYHRLLTLRIRELSEAYRGCLFAHLTAPDGRYQQPKDGTLFSNGFQTYIEAAIHAFLADAAGLRDLIAEAVWRLVLHESSRDVTTLASFLKKTRQRSEPLAEELRRAGAEGGWLKVLTDLRNSVTHVAPLANTYELHMTELRLAPLKGGRLPVAHYPLLTAAGALRERPSAIDFDDEAQVVARLQTYRQFVAGSRDALAYASDTVDSLVRLATAVRTAAGLKSKMRTITDADIIGEPIIYRGAPGPQNPPL